MMSREVHVETVEQNAHTGRWESFRLWFTTEHEATKWIKKAARSTRLRRFRSIVLVVREDSHVSRRTFVSRFPTRAERAVKEAFSLA